MESLKYDRAALQTQLSVFIVNTTVSARPSERSPSLWLPPISQTTYDMLREKRTCQPEIV
jgi:hypothetical protein